jgi:hypothetical protein
MARRTKRYINYITSKTKNVIFIFFEEERIELTYQDFGKPLSLGGTNQRTKSLELFILSKKTNLVIPACSEDGLENIVEMLCISLLIAVPC